MERTRAAAPGRRATARAPRAPPTRRRWSGSCGRCAACTTRPRSTASARSGLRGAYRAGGGRREGARVLPAPGRGGRAARAGGADRGALAEGGFTTRRRSAGSRSSSGAWRPSWPGAGPRSRARWGCGRRTASRSGPRRRPSPAPSSSAAACSTCRCRPRPHAHPELQGPLDFANVRIPALARSPLPCGPTCSRPDPEGAPLPRGAVLCLVRFDYRWSGHRWSRRAMSCARWRGPRQVGHTGVTVPGEDHPELPPAPRAPAAPPARAGARALELGRPLDGRAPRRPRPRRVARGGGAHRQPRGAAPCGDLGAAVRVLRELGGPGAGALIDDFLLRWSVSDAHLGLREMLGLGVVPPGWQPHALAARATHHPTLSLRRVVAPRVLLSSRPWQRPCVPPQK